MQTPTPSAATVKPTMGFWRCWSLSVGTMVGSGVFLLPAVLAPYGGIGFLGWAVTGAGALLIALTLGHLASRQRSPGGPYAFARDAFGSLAGFLVGWAYWISCVAAAAAIAVAFAGYLAVFLPVLADTPLLQAGAALAILWTLATINAGGIAGASLVQLAMTLLKLLPLLLVVGVAAFAGDAGNLPDFNPSAQPLLPALASAALLTMWAYAGLESSTIPAADVIDPERTIPRATVVAVAGVAALYMAATAAVMLLVPAGILEHSTAPFAEAARSLGSAGPPLIAAGALVATAGALNGILLVGGQMPMAVALDGLAPAFLARRNRAGAPRAAVLLSAGLASALLVLNYADGLVAAFTVLITMSTLALLAPLAIAALADLKHSWRTARGWALVAIASFVYASFAILGSGLEVIGWGLVLMAAGLPVYALARRRPGGLPRAAVMPADG
ncbi:MAG: amino acid permease [Steroidobacteraceae bacterium]|jgi:APA family basic amino acid/polyamine antiporter|nr:amino acid permease [Steroidobacteraceae bacterium]